MAFITDLGLTIIPAYALYTQTVPDNQLSVSESTSQGRHSIIIDFNNNEGLYTRDLGTIFSWPTNNGIALDVWQPSVAAIDDDVYDRLSFHFLMRSLGVKGWGHVREMNIAHASNADLTLLLSFGVGAVPASITLTIPNSGGQETKTKVTLPANKFKLIEGWISSTQPFKLWGADLELKVKEWGSPDAYQVVRPFQG